MTQEVVGLIFVAMISGSSVVTAKYIKWLKKEERTKERKKENKNDKMKFFKIVNR